jgi:hypothetical protein
VAAIDHVAPTNNKGDEEMTTAAIDKMTDMAEQ